MSGSSDAMTFIHDDFLLSSPMARTLYHEHAKPQPIIDYHCHLDPALVARDHRFESLTELWLAGDHYKWRAMRAHGVPERLLTGDASPFEKFAAWADTVPATLRNPLYHWTHLELAFPFGITDRLLGPDTARELYDACNARLAEPEFSARGLQRQYRVEVVCTTDDPTDSLEHHLAYRDDGTATTQLRPTWRPDRALAIEDPETYGAWVDSLAAAASQEIDTYDRLLEALAARHAYFHEAGCRLSDHGLTTLHAADCSLTAARQIFARVRRGERVAADEIGAFRSALLHELALMNHARGWVQQLHLGPLRNLSTRRFAELGPDTGFDAMGDDPVGRPLARFLDRLDRRAALAKTIVYNINPRDNEVITTILGSFQGDVPGKMQFGSAWWFMDQLDGMTRQLDTLSNLGLLTHFVGMLTDSRSFLSYSRHDYFRRLLCDLLGADVQRGLLPADSALLGRLVERVSYRNARDYFGFFAD